MIKQIYMEAREKRTQDGKKFLIYTAKTAEGKRVPIKFRQEVQVKPNKAGKFIVSVETENMNLSHNDFGDVWWIRSDCESVEEFIPEDTAKDVF